MGTSSEAQFTLVLGSGPSRTTAYGRQAPPSGLRRPTAHQHEPVVRPRSSGVRRTSARRLPATSTGTRPIGDFCCLE